ncbi:TVP38/TMEM64 family protein [Brevibacillus invocatus]|uniref:TVP38/TMEM64 family membrane protein n=1 Tax=Brevibacillus invocatus TaxID=173959 RepID=A0A3M8CMW7_9BACL|nr:TVP38/TMEM64 family protein [Brevibacillus invocatus]MCM3080065.1 TVP38/TMEM64 family protein [Brevibacillus invocatus]MCM3430258.1 TVP38/TMEM64 family protein [Brevibacillus invocatus]RNB76929.1 TVP38/TMEM64 family protein [Brevibacillus invocatus]
MIKKIVLAVFYLGIGLLIYAYGEAILKWFQEADNISLVAFMATIMALFPVIPYPLVGGVIGAAYGPVWGGLVTWIGSTAASILMFLFVRYGYQEWGTRILNRYERIGKLTGMFERNAFLTIAFARCIPIVPSIVVNVYCALSRVSFLTYAIASALGKIPAMLLFAVVGDNLMTEPRNILLTVGIYSVFLGTMLFIHRKWKQRVARGRI